MKIKMILLLAFIVSGVGCATAPQEPIGLKNGYYDEPASIAIYQKSLPEKAKMTTPGASCLLCLAAAAAANADVSSHIRTLDTDELLAAIKEIEAIVEQEDMDAEWVDIEEAMSRLPRFSAPEESGYPREDYRPLKSIVDADHLMVIEFSHVGVERTYNGYIPTSSPEGAVTGKFYIVDLKTNQYYMFDPIHVRVPVNGDWKEPPEYPGVTSAYFKALERAKIEISRALVEKEPVSLSEKGSAEAPEEEG